MYTILCPLLCWVVLFSDEFNIKNDNQLGPILTKVLPAPFQQSQIPMQGQYQLRPMLTQWFPGPYQPPQEIRNIQGQNLMHQVNFYRMNNQHSSIQQANIPMVNHFGNVRQNEHQKISSAK